MWRQQSRSSAWRSQLVLRILGEHLFTFFGTDLSEYVSHYVKSTEQISSMAKSSGFETRSLDFFKQT
jgi:hypothetical protein